MNENQENVEKIKRDKKQWQRENPEKVKESTKRWYEKNKERMVEYKRRWLKENPEYKKQWYQKNKEKVREYQKRWCQKNPEYARRRQKERCKTDLKYSLNRRIGSAIWKSLKGNKSGRCWETLVDYTVEDLRKRLEKTMPKGYTWQDYINGKLHIDHIIPTSVFNFAKPEHIDFKKSWALENLQLLPAEENYQKNNKLEQPFQPSLRLISEEMYEN